MFSGTKISIARSDNARQLKGGGAGGGKEGHLRHLSSPQLVPTRYLQTTASAAAVASKSAGAMPLSRRAYLSPPQRHAASTYVPPEHPSACLPAWLLSPPRNLRPPLRPTFFVPEQKSPSRIAVLFIGVLLQTTRPLCTSHP